VIAIFARELRAYFITPIGYLYMGLFLLLTGIFFTFGNLMSQSSQFSGFLGNLLFIYLFAVPLLTMRLFSEERRQKTDQLLLTSPVSIPAIVIGKFLAAMTLYAATAVLTPLYAVVVAVFGDLQVWETVGSYVGFLFLGAGYISVGAFISASTENQLTAALVTFFSLLVILLIDSIAQMMPQDLRSGLISAGVLVLAAALFLQLNARNIFLSLAVLVAGALVVGGFWLFKRSVYTGFLQNFLGWFSLNRRYQPFAMGLLKVDALLYYASFAGLFLFLTVRLIEKRRWN